MTYAVAQRMGEFGLRLALGSTPMQLSQLVLARGLALAGAGVVIGSGAAWALTRLIRSLLYEIQNSRSPIMKGVAARSDVQSAAVA